MSNEIATYQMIKTKTTYGTDSNEAPTKTEIKAISQYLVIANEASYSNNELVKIDDISAMKEEVRYNFSVTPTTMSFGAAGGTKSFTVTSNKQTYLNGVAQGTATTVSHTNSITGSGFNLSGDSVYATANTTIDSISGTVTVKQNETNNTKTISLTQSGDTISSYGDWVITVSANPTSVSSSGGTSTITASAKRTVYWESGDVTEETGDPTLSTNLGSLSSTASPSTLTLGENTSTSSRTATITASYSGKSATCTVTQSGDTPSTTYTFSVNPYNVDVGSSGGSGSVTITSYKTVGVNNYDVDYSIDSSTLPSWASFNKSTSTFTIQSTTSATGRTAKVYFDQDESGKRDYAELTQTGYTPPADNYVFTWEGGGTSDVSANFPWDFSANGAAANIPVVSTKNGSSQSWSVSSKPSWITTSTTSSKVTISASDNSGSARSGEVVLTQSGSGKTLTVNVSQAAYSATVEWRYKIGFANGALSNISVVCRDYHAVGQSSPFTVTFLSYKSKYVDGVEDTSTRQYLDFSISSSQTWLTATKTTSSNANEGKFATAVSENGSTSNRTGTITVTQNESQKVITCDITQVSSNAFVASYFVKFRGSDTYPSEINFGLVTAPTSKEFEVESSFEIYTIASEYNSYNYQFGAIRRLYWVSNFMSFTDNSWFTSTYEVEGGEEYKSDLLTINAPVSDGQDRAVPIYIVQSQYTGNTDWNYREITNSPILGQILVKQSGNKIS